MFQKFCCFALTFLKRHLMGTYRYKSSFNTLLDLSQFKLPLGMPQGGFVLELSKKSKSYFLAGGKIRATCPTVGQIQEHSTRSTQASSKTHLGPTFGPILHSLSTDTEIYKS